jgi:hypothetical protein
MTTVQISKKRKITIGVLLGLLGVLFAYSLSGKFMAMSQPEGEMAKNFIRYGLDGKVALIAIGELSAVLLFFIPKTSSLGVLVLSAHMGGAIATHMEHGEPFAMQSIVLVLLWVVAYLRNPAIFASFKRGAGTTAE